MAGQPLPFGDYIQPFQVESLGIRGRLARLGGGLAAAIAPHRYPGPVDALLAETVTLAATLASTLKFDGVFTLQTQGDGPIGVLMADVTSKGGFRAYARVDAARLAAVVPDAAAASVPRLLGAGYLAFTVDQGPDTDRYQGITELNGATLAECAQAYFRQSEQLETAIASAATGAGNGDGVRAAALMIQRLPVARGSREVAAGEDGGDGEEGDHWRRAVALMSTITLRELLDPALRPSEILYRLYHREGVRVYRTKPLFHACRCSREKVVVTLGSFAERDIRDMAEDGRLTVTCEFCKTDYHFDDAELATLFADRPLALDRGRANP
jgi:molecular chaperone Hsp33